MRISHLLAALTVIAYAALQLGEKVYTMRLIWWGVLITAVVWILEQLLTGFPAVKPFSRHAHPTQPVA